MQALDATQRRDDVRVGSGQNMRWATVEQASHAGSVQGTMYLCRT